MEEALLTITKYANRKLYDVVKSRTLYLSDLRQMVERGEPFRVIEHESGKDITAKTLAKAVAYSTETYKIHDLSTTLKGAI